MNEVIKIDFFLLKKLNEKIYKTLVYPNLLPAPNGGSSDGKVDP